VYTASLFFLSLWNTKNHQMILTVNYNKATGDITLSSDIDSILVDLNTNSIQDSNDELVFEVAIDTNQYEEINKLPEEEIITEE